MTWAVLASIVLTWIWTLILAWQQECGHGGKRALDGYLPKRREQDESEWARKTIHSYWRWCTLKCCTKLWSSCLITLISPISPFLCGEELLCCGKLPKAEWKGPFIMRKWHNTQSPLSWVWYGSFKAPPNLPPTKTWKKKKNTHFVPVFPAERFKTINEQISGQVSQSQHFLL